MQTWNDVISLANHGAPAPPRRVEKTAAEWRVQLTAEQYHVTREHGTERAFTGEYCEAHEAGLYACVCCGTPLFPSDTKFESGTGWPSFWKPVTPENVREEQDVSFWARRTEVVCAACDAHLGHVFPDGPKDRGGMRYCLNGVALKFIPKDKMESQGYREYLDQV